jgi:hypothetical protein
MTIRVLLDASTTMVRSALQAALGECDDIELVDPAGFDPPPRSVDVIVLQRRLMDEFPGPLSAIGSASRIGVVAINDDGLAGDLYRIDHRGWHFRTGPRGGLADAIRAVASAG